MIQGAKSLMKSKRASASFRELGMETCLEEFAAEYLGGHSRYSKASGLIAVGENEVIFLKVALRKKNMWTMGIPYDKVSIEKVQTGAEHMSSGFGMIWPTVTKSTITIPFVDEDELEQRPKFSIKLQMDKFAQLVHAKLTEVRKKKPEKETKEDLIVKLDERLAKGEISEETYKKVLARLEKRKEKRNK